MLEEELGCTLLEKLREMLLVEAAFNFSNKIRWYMVCGCWTMIGSMDIHQRKYRVRKKQNG